MLTSEAIKKESIENPFVANLVKQLQVNTSGYDNKDGGKVMRYNGICSHDDGFYVNIDCNGLLII